MIQSKKNSTQYIKWSLVFLFIANGFYHFTGNQSYSYLFTFNTTLLTYSLGSLLISFGILAAFWKPYTTKFVYLFIIPSLILFINTIGSFIKAGYVFEQIIEHSSQFGLPLLFILCFIQSIHSRTIIKWSIITIALTFVGHGLFAVGLHYQPGNFMAMTMDILNIDTQQASLFLIIAGTLDFIVVLGVFFKPTRNISLIYIIFWGFVTALARTLYQFNEVEIIDLLMHSLPQTVFRLPNSILPLMIFLFYRNKWFSLIISG